MKHCKTATAPRGPLRNSSSGVRSRPAREAISPKRGEGNSATLWTPPASTRRGMLAAVDTLAITSIHRLKFARAAAHVLPAATARPGAEQEPACGHVGKPAHRSGTRRAFLPWSYMHSVVWKPGRIALAVAKAFADDAASRHGGASHDRGSERRVRSPGSSASSASSPWWRISNCPRNSARVPGLRLRRPPRIARDRSWVFSSRQRAKCARFVFDSADRLNEMLASVRDWPNAGT